MSKTITWSTNIIYHSAYLTCLFQHIPNTVAHQTDSYFQKSLHVGGASCLRPPSRVIVLFAPFRKDLLPSIHSSTGIESHSKLSPALSSHPKKDIVELEKVQKTVTRISGLEHLPYEEKLHFHLEIGSEGLSLRAWARFKPVMLKGPITEQWVPALFVFRISPVLPVPRLGWHNVVAHYNYDAMPQQDFCTWISAMAWQARVSHQIYRSSGLSWTWIKCSTGGKESAEQIWPSSCGLPNPDLYI